MTQCCKISKRIGLEENCAYYALSFFEKLTGTSKAWKFDTIRSSKERGHKLKLPISVQIRKPGGKCPNFLPMHF